MSLMNDYTFQTLNDQQERDLARLAEHNRRVRLAMNGHVSWWRRVLSVADNDASPSQRPSTGSRTKRGPAGSQAGGTIVLMVKAARSATTVRTQYVVGRAEQRARLGQTLDDVIDDGSRFVIIGGDAGAGKTTVVEAFVADLFGSLADRKAQLIRGQCVPPVRKACRTHRSSVHCRIWRTSMAASRSWSGSVPAGRRSALCFLT